MNHFKIVKIASLYEKLFGLFTLVFLSFGLVFWGFTKLDIAVDFFYFVSRIMGYVSLVFVVLYIISNFIRCNSEIKVLAAKVRKQY